MVGAFEGLSRARSDARRYPSIDPLDSWSKYPSVVDEEELEVGRRFLRQGNEVGQMMKVVGEEGTSIDDFLVYLKSEYLDAVYLQQDAYHDVDGATGAERQRYVYGIIAKILSLQMNFKEKADARTFFQTLTQISKDWNRVTEESDEFKKLESQIQQMLTEVTANE